MLSKVKIFGPATEYEYVSSEEIMEMIFENIGDNYNKMNWTRNTLNCC